jgi:hypothetical protein
LRKRSTYLYTVTFDDYIHAFKQFTLYKQYLQGGPFGHGPDTNELLLRRTQGSSDPTKLITVVANYTYELSFTNHLPHLKGEEVLGLLNNLLIVLLALTVIPIILTM